MADYNGKRCDGCGGEVTVSDTHARVTMNLRRVPVAGVEITGGVLELDFCSPACVATYWSAYRKKHKAFDLVEPTPAQADRIREHPAIRDAVEHAKGLRVEAELPHNADSRDALLAEADRIDAYVKASPLSLANQGLTPTPE